MPHATLAIIEGREAGREFAVTGTTLLGRDPGADVVVADSDVSPRHASFVVVDGGIAVEDLGSSQGTCSSPVSERAARCRSVANWSLGASRAPRAWSSPRTLKSPAGTPPSRRPAPG